jgi:hypothetical protein
LIRFFLFLKQLEEAKRLIRRISDCFSFEEIDITTAHVILPDDDPQMTLTLYLFLELIYGRLVFYYSNIVRIFSNKFYVFFCSHFVIFKWLKFSSRIGEWSGVNVLELNRLCQIFLLLFVFYI